MEAKTNYIEGLLEAYFEGNTSLQQEEELRVYFSKKGIAPHLKAYQPLFQALQQEKEAELNKDSTHAEFVFQFPVSEQTPTNKSFFKWGSVAASFIVLLTISGLFFQDYQQQQTEAAELAFMQTKQALLKVSSEFNSGLQNLEHLQQIDKTTPFFNLNNK